MTEFRAEARREGISEKTLEAALRDITPVKRVIELDRSQPARHRPHPRIYIGARTRCRAEWK